MTKATRQRRWRQRRATGVCVLRIPVREFDLVTALIAANRLGLIEAMDRTAVAREASEILAEWSRVWNEH